MPPKLDKKSDTERASIVAPSALFKRVDAWRRKQPRIPTKSEALRILIERALDQHEGAKK